MTAKDGFNITSLLNTTSIKQAKQTRKKINYRKLIPNELNHYSMENIEELADSIQNFGLSQDLLVKPLGNDTYRIDAGHRRHAAIKMLVEVRKLIEFEDIGCIIEEQDEDDYLSQIRLHITNITARTLTDHDKLTAVSSLKRLFSEAEQKGFKFKGRMRDLIGEQMGLGATQVQKYLSVNKNASDDIKQAMVDGELSIEEAYQEIKKEPKRIKNDDCDLKNLQNRGSTDEINHFTEDTTEQHAIVMEKFTEFKQVSDVLNNPVLNQLLIKLEKQLNKLIKHATKT